MLRTRCVASVGGFRPATGRAPVVGVVGVVGVAGGVAAVALQRGLALAVLAPRPSSSGAPYLAGVHFVQVRCILRDA
ncbi:hypothetical protein [Sorangium sp. So ce1389]|uniref:hypothetical protein n=1 Tax=Sorangium sp. So ce1389 TaxID=3133336 RepID=UPI003F61FDAF